MFALFPKLPVIKRPNTFSGVALIPTIKIGKVEFRICRYDRISHLALKDLLARKRICDARTNTEPGAIATGSFQGWSTLTVETIELCLGR